MPSPPPQFEIFRCPNYLTRDPPCQGWVRAQGIKCNNCIANGWSLNSDAPSIGGLAQSDPFDLPKIQKAIRNASLSGADSAESAYSWYTADEKPSSDATLVADDMPQLIWPNADTNLFGDAHYPV